MITPQEIKKKAERKYHHFLRHLIEPTEPFFPLPIPFTRLKTTADYTKLRQTISSLQTQSKKSKGFGYTIEWHTQQTRQYGPQTLPKQIYFADQNDYLLYLGKQNEVKQFSTAVAQIGQQFPQLKEWLIQHPQQIIKHHPIWPDLLRVCRYFVNTPRPDRYIRELPITVHTKFIEQNTKILRLLLDQLLPSDAINHEATLFTTRFHLRQPEPLIRLRLLDPPLKDQLHWPATDLSLPLSSFSQIDLSNYRFFIIENLMTFLTFPTLPQSIAIWGQGNGVLKLKNTSWLAQSDLHYWGDLDAQGFEILATLRASFPAVNSLLMDKTTFQTHQEFSVTGTPSRLREPPTTLHPAETALYLELKDRNLRLEQERIPQSYINQHVSIFT